MFGQTAGKSWKYNGPTHTEALNRLVYVAEQGEAFVLLTGDHGVGKTTVLTEVKARCSRLGCSVILLNVAALDELSFLWHLCGGLSITPRSDQHRSEMMTAIRDELAGRALCNSRTVIVLDDLHSSADDLSLMIQFLAAINQQTNGGVSVIAAAESGLSAELQNLSALSVTLPLLDEGESRDFITGMLASGDIANDRISEDGVEAVLASAQGSPSQLTRICEVIQVAAMTDESLLIDADVLHALTAETLRV